MGIPAAASSNQLVYGHPRRGVEQSAGL